MSKGASSPILIAPVPEAKKVAREYELSLIGRVAPAKIGGPTRHLVPDGYGFAVARSGVVARRQTVDGVEAGGLGRAVRVEHMKFGADLEEHFELVSV